MEYKPLIRSILLSLGRRASEKEFRSAYLELQGETFNVVLGKVGMSFYNFMKSLPDVCQVWRVGDTIEVVRVSTEDSSHMDRLTIEKKKMKAGKKSAIGTTQRF
jgi:starvation-inducible outer membrane lipoprotein